jgi:hypothetical protein
MEMTTPVYPASLPVGGMGYGGYGGAMGLGAGAIGLLFGALLGNGGLGGLGGNGGLNTAINANQSGQIAGLEAGVANIQNALNTNSLQDGLIALSQAINSSASTINNGIADLSTAQQAGNFTTLSSINGLGRDISAQSNQQALQQLNSFNILNTSMLQGFNEIGRDTATATNQLIMGQNALSAQLASCCCKLGQDIRDDGALTRALINDLNVQRLTSELNDAKNSISNSNQTNALVSAMAQQTNVILQHLPLIIGGGASASAVTR